MTVLFCLLYFSQPAAIKSVPAKARVWLKLDACDVKPALQESTRQEWNGDEDLGTGETERLRETYLTRRKLFQDASTDVLPHLKQFIEEDINFLREGLTTAVATYQAKMQQRCSEQVLMEKCWEVADYNILLQQALLYKQKVEEAVNAQSAAILQPLVGAYMEHLRNLFKKKRKVANTGSSRMIQPARIGILGPHSQ